MSPRRNDKDVLKVKHQFDDEIKLYQAALKNLRKTYGIYLGH